METRGSLIPGTDVRRKVFSLPRCAPKRSRYPLKWQAEGRRARVQFRVHTRMGTMRVTVLVAPALGRQSPPTPHVGRPGLRSPAGPCVVYGRSQGPCRRPGEPTGDGLPGLGRTPPHASRTAPGLREHSRGVAHTRSSSAHIVCNFRAISVQTRRCGKAPRLPRQAHIACVAPGSVPTCVTGGWATPFARTDDSILSAYNLDTLGAAEHGGPTWPGFGPR